MKQCKHIKTSKFYTKKIHLHLQSEQPTTLIVSTHREVQWQRLSTSSITQDEMEIRINSLTVDQKRILQYIKNCYNNSALITSEPLHIFCTGGAGTGKSFLLSTIVEFIKLYYPKISGCSPVLVTAPTGEATSEDIFTLSKRLLNLYPDICTDNMLHIYPTLREVREFNEDIQKNVNPNFHTHEATPTFSPFNESSPGQTVSDDLITADDRQGGGLPRRLSISLGTRVMLLRNICTKEGLINGAMGFGSDFEYIDSSLSVVYVKFNDSSVGVNFMESSKNNFIPIRPYNQELIYKGRIVDRLNFPLAPCWACTVHKTQGLSLEILLSLWGKHFVKQDRHMWP